MRASDESPAYGVPVGALARCARVQTPALGIIVMALVALACGNAKPPTAQVIVGRHDTLTSVASPDTTGAGPATTGSKPSSGGQGQTTTSEGGVVPTTAPRPTTTTALKSALQRRDVPPGAVPAQFPATPPTTIPPCGPGIAPEPTIRSASSVEIATTMEVCFPGFTPRTPVDVAVTPASGPVRNARATDFSPGGAAYLELYAVPGDPLGTYAIEARQGSVRAESTFLVKPASRRHFLVLPPASVPPGTTIRFALAGFPPDSSVLLSLYAGSRYDAPKYLTEIGPATTDGDGQSTFELQTASGDPPGPYCVAYRTSEGDRPDSCAGFFQVGA